MKHFLILLASILAFAFCTYLESKAQTIGNDVKWIESNVLSNVPEVFCTATSVL